MWLEQSPKNTVNQGMACVFTSGSEHGQHTPGELQFVICIQI